MTLSPSESGVVTTNPVDTETTVHPLQEYADQVAASVGGTAEILFDTVKVSVPTDGWVTAHQIARDDLGLVFFSWLSAIDWSNETAIGEALNEETEERFEILTTVSDLSEGMRVTFSTVITKDSPTVPTLIEVYAGANWHERESAEMFGIVFDGHPNLTHLYLPDAFVGNPLKKDYPLLSREVKPWPGTVDVEPMPDKPSTENPGA